MLLAAIAAGSLGAALADAPLAPVPSPSAVGVVSPKLLRYAERAVRKHDKNQSGQLEADEWPQLSAKPAEVDANGDGRISVEELAQHAANFGAGRAIRLSPGAESTADVGGARGTGDSAVGAAANGSTADPRRHLKYFAALPAGIPPWFVERDTDGDSQLTLAEFSPKLLKGEIDDFNHFDINRDGVLTAKEYLRAGKEAAAAPAAAVPQP